MFSCVVMCMQWQCSVFLVRWDQEPSTGASAEAQKWLKLESYVFIATATALDRQVPRLTSEWVGLRVA